MCVSLFRSRTHAHKANVHKHVFVCTRNVAQKKAFHLILPVADSSSISFCWFCFLPPFFFPFFSFLLLSVMLSEESISSQERTRREEKKTQVVLLGTCGKWAPAESEPVTASLLLYRLTPIKCRPSWELRRGRIEGREGGRDQGKERK